MTKILFEGVIRDMTPAEEKEHNDFRAEVASRQYETELRDLTNGLTTADEVIAKNFPTKPGEEE
jgi:glutamine synthetase